MSQVANHSFDSLTGRCTACGKAESDVLAATEDDIGKSYLACGEYRTFSQYDYDQVEAIRQRMVDALKS